MTKRFTLNALTFLFLLFTVGGYAQSDYMKNLMTANPNVQYDRIFSSNIQTVQFSQGDIPNVPPLLALNSDNFVSLTFDEVGSKAMKQYQFTIVLCNADWTPSSLYQSDYIDGLFQDYIQYDSISYGTYKPYVHYRIDIPSQKLKPRVSGNYILKVFLDDPNKPILQERFYVYEQAVGIYATAQRPDYARYREAGQQVMFNINTRGLNIMDPYHDLKVVIKQDWRWDNEIGNLQPQYIQDTTLLYNYQEGNIFPGVNEFRFFDIHDLKYRGLGVRSYSFDSLYNAWLYTDEDRSINAYNYYTDMNGGYVIAVNSPNVNVNPAMEGDYAIVHFSLRPSYRQDPEDKVYVYGAVTNWQIDDKFRMNYDDNDQLYKTTVRLKQGVYNYWYVVVNSKGEIDPTIYEGSHWEAENYYTILVYYRLPSMLTDRLIGIARVNSMQSQH
jgi:hypothetical protein